MDATIEQSKKRAKRINSIEIALLKIKKNKKLLDQELFIIEICEAFSCSDRTAREYLKIAKNRIPGGMIDRKWANDDKV